MALREWFCGVQGIIRQINTSNQRNSSETQRLQRREQVNHHIWWISFGQPGPTCTMHACLLFGFGDTPSFCFCW